MTIERSKVRIPVTVLQNFNNVVYPSPLLVSFERYTINMWSFFYLVSMQGEVKDPTQEKFVLGSSTLEKNTFRIKHLVVVMKEEDVI